MRLATVAGELARRGFEQPDRAAERLADLGALGHELDLDVLAGLADPDLAVATLADMARVEPEAVVELVSDTEWLRRVVAVAGTSEPLARHLATHPFDAHVVRDTPRRVSAPGIAASLAAAVGASDGFQAWGDVAPDAADRLRLANRRQLIRIVARDVLRDDPWDFSDISAELSDLADGILAGALWIAGGEVPRPADVRLAVVAVGKCGGQELNYISDVDVLFVVEPAGGSADQASAVGTRLAAALTRICSAHTRAGSIWDVDAALRPEGKAGPLVRSLSSMRQYYERWAKNWEFQAMLKARPAAGDVALGQEFVDLVDDRVWRAAESDGFVADAQAMRQRVVDTIPGAQAERDLKLSQGGLRDVEFTVQLLQLVHGRADESLRARATLPALSALVDGGYVGRDEGAELAEHYRLLRTLEHRIQLRSLRRTHLMPDDEASLRRLGRGLGMDPVELVEQWKRTTRSVHRLQRRVFYSPLLDAVAKLPTEQVRLTPDAAGARLRALGFVDPKAALRHLEALTQGMTRQAQIQRQLLPAMLGWFADGPNPDAGLLSFRQISDALGRTSWYLRALRDEGEVARRLARTLSTSRYAVDLLVRNPSGVRLLVEDGELAPRGRDDLSTAMLTLARRHDNADEAIAAIRSARGRELLRIALGDVLHLIDLDAVSQGLSDLTGATLDAALDVAARDLGSSVPIGIIAMGRWGGRESGYGSDADAMFVVDTAHSDELHSATSVVARMRTLLAAPGPDPALVIDPDLRPEGRQGALVRSIDSYADYYSRWSSTWEKQALVRASFGAGDRELVGRFLDVIAPTRYPKVLTKGELADIRKLKVRIDHERMPRGSDPLRNVKLGPGGLVDVEWTVQLQQLRHASDHPSLRVTGTLEALGELREKGLISESDAADLELAWRMASRIRNAIMVARGRASDAIPSDARDVAAIGWLLGYGRADASALIDDYLRAARRASKVVERLFWEDA